ncbi:transcription-repair coupling factor [Candidatus Profftia sp. (ex Adelges kitamiensis)]|uniref:transcription-repair coupling factor n=1 Tax=Candidatus Profftia sp. (ex Adelges kitamiensis) TaxID=2864218 RepID=UPI001CE2AAC6|nr:transcription-repair coupling factor [Candidatus Profftia sp. (ex Adelges kitamiensis)]
MPKQYKFSLPQRYIVPKRFGDVRFLGQMTESAYALECAHIAEKHSGLVIIITSNIQSALRMRHEIQHFTLQMVITLYDWETLPYDNFSPNKNIISARISVLYKLPTIQHGVLILPVSSLMQRVCPREFLHGYTLMIQKGERLCRKTLLSYLEQAGYRIVDQVLEHGEFSLRGELLEIYLMGNDTPYRINFFDDKIDSIHIFDINSQRILNEIEYIHLLPSHEFPTDKNAIKLFRIQWREHLEVCRDPEHIYQQVSKGIWPSGIEYWQPLFFHQELPPLLSYFPLNTLLINTSDLKNAADNFWSDVNQRYENRRTNPMRPLLTPDKLWLRVDELFIGLKKWPRIQLHTNILNKKYANTNLNYYDLPELKIQAQNKIPLDNLSRFLKITQDTIIFLVESEGRREIMLDLLSCINISPELIIRIEDAEIGKIHIMQGSCEHGFINTTLKLILICENDLLGTKISRIQQNNYNQAKINHLIQHFAELSIGDPVVHLEHGIGRYGGVIILEIGGIKNEYFILNYADDARLYVPVSSLNLLNRYLGGANESIPLHKLGSDAWARLRQKAAEKASDVAAQLLDIHSMRLAKIGFAFKQNDESYKLFCQSFPFKTTIDQNIAINDVLNDMCKPLPMDRLVCGDVGFGKTEVAMRAAFLAVNNNKQVAVLVPTTLLAQQHYDNFRNRFANWPVRIEMISRFRSAKEQNYILQDTANGKIDILIGTHKILQNDIHWRDLALLIIDEEHRFGVRQKEKIKAIRSVVDLLTLTATPIPRTLNMAMGGIRDLSIIATPPERRLPVKTFVRDYNHIVIREAILREIMRGGQVYYLCNNIKNIEKVAQHLSTLVPEARIKIGHGQMQERALELVMNDFYHQRFNVLVCTTIIETGIDIPSANTVVIERADLFGVAQLHQLRGRVGRSFHQAYAYLLIPPLKVISKDAQKRLEAISSLEDLGAGLTLATHDLEIRGAGEILGSSQSGQITSVGLSLYMELLERAVDALKVGREPALEDITRNQVDIELRIPTLLPDDYIPNVNTRLSFYKRIASAQSNDDLENLKVELIDRFGILPHSACNLIQIAQLRLDCMVIGINRINSDQKGGFLKFSDKNNIEPIILVKLLQNKSHIFSIKNNNQLAFVIDLSEYKVRIKFIADLLVFLKT